MGAESSGFTAAGAAPEWPQGGVTGFPFNLAAHAAQQGTRNGCKYNRDRGGTLDQRAPLYSLSHVCELWHTLAIHRSCTQRNKLPD